MRWINRFVCLEAVCVEMALLGSILGSVLVSQTAAMAQTTTEVPVPTVPDVVVPIVNTDQLFQPIPDPSTVAVPEVPEVTNVVSPQVPTAVFPETNLGTVNLETPTFPDSPFVGPTLTAPPLSRPNLAAPALAAPALVAPAFIGFQGSAPQFDVPDLAAPAFAAPNLAAPALSAPTLNFLSAPEADSQIQSPTLPDVQIPETVLP